MLKDRVQLIPFKEPLSRVVQGQHGDVGHAGQFTGPHGEQVDASPKYTIDVLKDQPPVVSFTKPGRDNSASPVEEVFVEAKANDDFGVK